MRTTGIPRAFSKNALGSELKKYVKYLETGISKLTGALLGLIVTLVSMQVILRFFGSPLVWSEELSRYLYIWMVLVGAALSISDRSHMKVELIIERLPELLKKSLYTFI